MFRALSSLAIIVVGALPAFAYVEAPMSLGAIIAQAHVICVMTVTKVDKAQNIIIYQKVADVKGKHPQDTIKHIIKQELKPGEIRDIMNWAEPGKMALFFHNGSASETCTGSTWYQAYPQGEWWSMTHGEPFLMRSYAGKVEKLIGITKDILDGKEVVVPCMVDGNKDDLHKKTARIQRLKASLKLQDYNPKRDFVGWGGEDIRRLYGMPGFSHFAALGRVDNEAHSISPIDFNNDGKIDICLTGTSRVMLLDNQGDAYSETLLPGLSGGARSATWGDYNRDGLPDLLLTTTTGPRLYTNLGKGQFRDDTKLLPRETCYDLTAAGWIDADGDGQLDILLANGFHGMRLYRNKCPKDAVTLLAPPKLGDWYFIGPFDNTGNRGFDMAYPPEKELDLKKQYEGKKNLKVSWKKGTFADGQINSLTLFPNHNDDSVVYLFREIDVTAPTELPISLGSDDTLTVWLNDERLLAENVQRACAADQHRLTLHLTPGKNKLLLKIGQGKGDWAYYFAPGNASIGYGGWFEDVSESFGLGADQPISQVKAEHVSLLDITGDGKPEVVVQAGQVLIYQNTGKRFEAMSEHGLPALPAKTSLVWGDVDHDGRVDVVIPSNGFCKLFRNAGQGKFTEITPQTGDLAKSIPMAVTACWADFNRDGSPDLFVGCLKGCNRYFENRGDGTFVEKTTEIGLHQRVFNTTAFAVSDLNGDGILDLITANEGQDAAILFGNKERPGKHVPVNIYIPAEAIGGQLQLSDANGKVLRQISFAGVEGRGGQASLTPFFALSAGKYRTKLVGTPFQPPEREFVVADSPVTVRFREPALPKQPTTDSTPSPKQP